MDNQNEIAGLLQAVSFAARSHKHQLRKDKETPYVAHVFRVCLILRDVFGISDRRVMTAAVLHDTIEDTLVDFDEIAEEFDAEIARWVAVLSKDKRLHDDKREKEYCEGLRKAPWQVQACKLADVYDNLMDMDSLPRDRRGHAVKRAETYLGVLAPHAAKEVHSALEKVQHLFEETKNKT